MKVKTTLFKTPFDSENMFVGLSKDSRQAIFDNFNPDNCKRLYDEKHPYSSYNNNDPFRLIGNFLDFDKIYNYIEFKFFDKDENIREIKHYFVHSYEYVSDDTTRAVVSEDIFSDHYYNFKIENMQPQKYTYKNSEIGKLYNPIDISDYFKIYSEQNKLSNIVEFSNKSINKGRYVLGFVLVTQLINFSGGTYDPRYAENGVKYPFRNALLPFLVDIDTGEQAILNIVRYKARGSTGLGTGIEDAQYLMDLLKSTESGVSNLSGYYWLNISDYFTVSTDANSVGDITITATADTSFAASVQENTSVGNLLVVNIVRLTKKSFSIGVSDLYKYPYKFSEVHANGQSVQVNYANLTSGELYYFQSFVPPYNITISYNGEYTRNPFFSIPNDGTMFEYTDAYAEWYKSNYNSTVTGLKVSQQNEQENLKIQRGGSLLRTMFGGFMNMRNAFSGAAGDALSGDMGGAASSIDNAMSRNTTNLFNFFVDTKTAQNILNNNQAKDNALLGLKIQDILNTPDKATFDAALTDAWLKKKYLRVFEIENALYFQALQHHKMYGYEVTSRVNLIRRHDNFDYVQATDMIFQNGDGYSFTEVDRASIESVINHGVRIWYSFENYKNFDIPNNEV